MPFTLPVMIRPSDIDMSYISSTKCKFHSLNLEQNDYYVRSKRVVRQFIHEVNSVNWDTQTVLAVYLNSKLIRYEVDGCIERTMEAKTFIDEITNFKFDLQEISVSNGEEFYNNDCDSWSYNMNNNVNLFYELKILGKDEAVAPEKPSPLKIAMPKKSPRLEFHLESNMVKDYRFHEKDITLHLKFIYEGNIDIIQIIITRERNTWYGAIDFGSEASQMKFVSSLNTVNIDPVLKNIDIDYIKVLEDIQKPATTAGGVNRYWQVDDGPDKFLYRSIFPVENLDTMPEDNFFLNEDSDVLKVEFLKSMSSPFRPNQSYLPNLKLLKQLQIHQADLDIQDLLESIKDSLFSNDDDFMVQYLINQVYPLLMANMIGLGILGMVSNKKLNSYVKHKGATQVLIPTTNIVVRVLVPNMFQAEEIFSLNLSLQEMFTCFKTQMITRLKLDVTDAEQVFPHIPNNMLKEAIERINAIEFMIMAEGDAVAVERNKGMDSEKFKQAEKFIVIDCGKGTTDVSIFKKNQDVQVLDTIYRGGFAGAGNAISKAVFDDFKKELEYSFTKTDVAKVGFLLQALTDMKLDLINDKLNVSRLIDGIKIAYFSESDQKIRFSDIETDLLSTDINNANEALNSLTDNIDSVLKKIQGKQWVLDYENHKGHRGYADAKLNSIVDEVIYQLEIGGVTSAENSKHAKIVVILSGRIFKSDKITKQFIESVGNKFGFDHVFNSIDSTNRNRNFSRSVELKKRCVEGGVEERPALNLNSDINGIPMFIRLKSKSTLPWKKTPVNQGGESIEISKIMPLKVTPHSYRFYTENILNGTDLQDDNENKLLLNRFPLVLNRDQKDFKIKEIYYIGRGFLCVAERGRKSICQILQPDYSNFLILQVDNPNTDVNKIQNEIKVRYLTLLRDSFFPFI
ncbi:MAG: hypothetical protein ACOYNC_01035 [Bacteroidales bacterium]